MFKKAVVAIDLSSTSELMTTHLGGLAPLGVTDLVIFHAMRDKAEKKGVEDEELMNRLAAIASDLRENGFTVSIRLEQADPARAISAVAAEENASLVVIGATTKSAAGGLIKGSTEREVIHRSRIPVLVMNTQPEHSSGQRHRRLASRDFSRHIVLGLDASATSQGALAILSKVAQDLHGKITLVHCGGPEGQTPEWLREQRSALKSVTECQVEAVFDHGGDPAKAILKAASTPSVSLIVLGTCGKSAAHEFFAGSESQTVVRHAEVPVLLIPVYSANAASGESASNAQGGNR